MEKAGAGKTFSEQQLLNEAELIDAAAHSQDQKNPVDQIIAGELPGETPHAEPVADPAIQKAMVVIVKLANELLTAKKGWDDPGDEWRNEVGRLSALLIDRYLPNFLEEQGEIVALCLMVGTYAAANLNAKAPIAAVRSNGNPGATGQRQNDFVSTDAPGPRSSAFGHT